MKYINKSILIPQARYIHLFRGFAIGQHYLKHVGSHYYATSAVEFRQGLNIFYNDKNHKTLRNIFGNGLFIFYS